MKQFDEIKAELKKSKDAHDALVRDYENVKYALEDQLKTAKSQELSQSGNRAAEPAYKPTSAMSLAELRARLHQSVGKRSEVCEDTIATVRKRFPTATNEEIYYEALQMMCNAYQVHPNDYYYYNNQLTSTFE